MTSVQVLDGVGPAIEERLSENGYHCLEQLAHSTLTESCGLKGVEPSMVLAAQEYLQSEREWTRKKLVRKADRQFWCHFCGRGGFSGPNGATTLKMHRKRCSENPSAPK